MGKRLAILNRSPREVIDAIEERVDFYQSISLTQNLLGNYPEELYWILFERYKLHLICNNNQL